MKTFLALVFVGCASWSFAQSGGPPPLEDDFPDLVGKWVADGTTHGLSVPQTIQVGAQPPVRADRPEDDRESALVLDHLQGEPPLRTGRGDSSE